MRRSSIITRFAIESGFMDEKKAKILEKEYQQSEESKNLTFESWAITKGHLKIEQAKSLLVTIASSRFMCTSCGIAFLGKELIGGTEYRCPDCNGEDFLLQSKAKSADDKVSKAPKLMTPPEGLDKEEIGKDYTKSMKASMKSKKATTGLGSILTDSIIENDEERAKREIEAIENESQKALKKAVFSRIPQKKLSDDEISQKVEFTAEMMDKGLPPGALLDGVRIEKIIGRGGIGIVYKGMDLTLERPVALKVLNSEVLSDKAQVERFGIEARSMAQLEHPNVVQVYKFGEKFSRPYLSMQWVDGENIGQKIDKVGALPITDCLYWFIQTARGLLEAHNHGIIHRDVKPDNIIVNSKGKVKIVDFGLAKQVVKAEHIGLSDPRFVLGTPAYIAPEQALGEEIDNRTDIYSFAISMFHALTGKLPFTGSPAAVVHQHISTPLPFIREYMPGIPEDLNKLIKVMSSKNMENRPNDMAEIVSKLEQILFDYDPEYASRVNISPKYDSIIANKKILAGTSEILAVYDESDEDTGNFDNTHGAQEGIKLFDNTDTSDDPLAMESIDLFDEIEKADLFNTAQNDFADRDMFSSENMIAGHASDNQQIDPRLNEEIQKIRQEVNQGSDLSESSDSIFDNEMDAFEDLQVEVLKSERSDDFNDFEFMREQLKQESFDSDDNEEADEFKPIGEVEYTEESDVEIADEEDILVTGKLQADKLMREGRKGDDSEDAVDEDFEDEEQEIRASKVKLQVSQSFASRAHKDEDSDEPGVAKISQEEVDKLMEEHKKLKSPKSIGVKRVIPTISVFIIVFMLSFMLFLTLKNETSVTGGGRNNTSIKADEVKLINHAQTCIIENNGTNAKYILDLINNLMKKHKDYNFSTTFLKCKADLAKFIEDFELNIIKEQARDFNLIDYSDFSSIKAKDHLSKLEEFMEINPKVSVEFDLTKKKGDLKSYIKKREKKEADEVQIQEFLKVYEETNTKDIKELYKVRMMLLELWRFLPDEYKTDDRLTDTLEKLDNYINKIPEKILFDKICEKVTNVHKDVDEVDEVVDLAEISAEFEKFLTEHPEFETGDDRVTGLREQIIAFSKEEKAKLEELKNDYTKWVQTLNAEDRNKLLRELLIKFQDYTSRIPSIANNPTIKAQYADIISQHKVDTALDNKILGYAKRAEQVKSIEEIDSLQKEIDDFLSVYKELKYKIYDTINELSAKRADFVRREKEEAEADEYKVKIDEFLAKLALNKKLVPEGEELVAVLKEKIEKELKFTEKFEELVRRLEIALRHERLVSQEDQDGFVWQAEKIRIDNKKVKLTNFNYTKMIGHKTEVTTLRFDSEKNFLMTCDKSGIVKVYIYKTMEEIRSFKIVGRINDAVFTDIPEYVVFALESGNLELWNIALREQMAIIKQFNKPIRTLAYHDGSVYCGGDNTDIIQIRLRNLGNSTKKPEFEEVGVFDDARGKINSIAISPDKNWIAAGSSDNIVYVWKLGGSGEEKFFLRNHSAAVISVSFSDDSKNLVSCGNDYKISVWSIVSRTMARDFLPNVVRQYKNAIYLDSNNVILYSEKFKSDNNEGQIEVIDIDEPSNRTTIDKIYGGFNSMQIEIMNGVKHLFCTKNDGRIYDYIHGVNGDWSVNFKTDYIIASDFLSDDDGELQVFSIFKSGLISLTKSNGDVIYNKTEAGVEDVICASISTEEKKAVIGTSLGKLLYVDIFSDTDDSKPDIKLVKNFNDPVTSVAMRSDASKVIVGLKNKTAYIFDSRGKESRKLSGMNGATEIAAVNSLDTLGIYGIKSGFITVITLPSGEFKRDPHITCSEITYADFNKTDTEITSETLFVGFKELNGKGGLVKFDTQDWEEKVLLSDLDAGIVSIFEISKTKMLIAFEDGEIHCYEHNLYEAEGMSNPKMERTCRIKFNDLSDYVKKLYRKDNSVYVLTSRGTLFMLDFE